MMDRSSSARVTVIVPVHNVAAYLERCVGSLLGQSYANLEIVLVDDGSTDASGALCHALARRDARVQVLDRPNGGVVEARNAGLAVATGEYVCFLDGDDWAEHDMVADLVRAAEQSDADVVMAGCVVDWENESGEVVQSAHQAPVAQVVRPGGTLVVSPEMVNLLGYVWNKLYRRDVLDRASRFEPGLVVFEDVVFNAHVFDRASTVAFVQQCHVHYVQRPRITLGTRFEPGLFELRLRAIDAIARVMGRWGGSPDDVAAVRTNLWVRAMWETILRTSGHRSWSLRQKGSHLRDVRSRPRAIHLRHELRNPDIRLSLDQRVVVCAFYTLPGEFLVLAAHVITTVRSVLRMREQ